MKITRADFLKSCTLALAGTFVEGAHKAHGNPLELFRWRSRLRLQDTTATFFRDYQNQSFSVRAGGSRARLVLAEVAEGPASKSIEQFSLIFHGPAGASIPDGTHAFQHPALGTFDLFVVAVGIPSEKLTRYQACFSRHASPAQPAAI